MSRLLSGIALCGLLLGCSKKDNGSSEPTAHAPDKVDFRLTAEEFDKDPARKSPRTEREKYRGKVIEITGQVWLVRPSGGDLVGIEFNTSGGRGTPTGLLFVRLQGHEGEKEQGLRVLSRGQTVTIRAVGGDLEQAKITSVGPSMAKPTTVAELSELHKTDPDFAEAQRDSNVILRVKVVARGAYVTDPNDPKTPLLRLVPRGDKANKDLETPAEGDVVFIIGVAQSDASGPRLEDARILSAPPAGVVLPATKK